MGGGVLVSRTKPNHEMVEQVLCKKTYKGSGVRIPVSEGFSLIELFVRSTPNRGVGRQVPNRFKIKCKCLFQENCD